MKQNIKKLATMTTSDRNGVTYGRLAVFSQCFEICPKLKEVKKLKVSMTDKSITFTIPD